MVLATEIANVDAKLRQADVLIDSDFKAAMDILGRIKIDIAPPQDLDPFGAGYADWVMEVYRQIAEVRDYDPSVNEADNNVTPDLPLQDYFPFRTRDLRFVGLYLTGVGLILSELSLPAGSRIVEYGVGWGHVSAALARAGHSVTCVDIEPKFLHLARHQAEAMGCRVETHHGAFGDLPVPLERNSADAAVFFEAFHHSFEHLRVLRRLREDVLRPGGVLMLAAEPVHPEFPYPWGIRPDGHALWAVRQHKWMELGFEEDYLLRALLREGFLVSRMQKPELGSFGLIYRARLHEGVVRLGETLLPSPEAASWAARPPQGEPHLFAQARSRATLDHDPSWSSLTVHLANYLSKPLSVSLDVGGTGPGVSQVLAPGELTEVNLPLPPAGRELRVSSEMAVPAELGMSDDHRALGVAIREIAYHKA